MLARRINIVLAVSIVGATALAAACADSFAPRDLAGTYALQSISDQGQPWQLGGTAGSGFSFLDADSLTLRADGTFVDALYISHNSVVTSPPSYTHDVTSAQGTWSVRGAAVTLTFAGAGGTFATGTVSGSVRTARQIAITYADRYAGTSQATYAQRTYVRP